MTDDEIREQLAWACSTAAFGVPSLYENNPEDSAFARGHSLALRQVLDVLENGWVDRRRPEELLQGWEQR